MSLSGWKTTIVSAQVYLDKFTSGYSYTWIMHGNLVRVFKSIMSKILKSESRMKNIPEFMNKMKHRTDIGSGLLWPETRPNRNRVWLSKNRPDPKNRVCNRIGFPGLRSSLGLDLFFFFCCCCLLNGKGKGCYWVISSLVQLLDTLFDCLDFLILVLGRFFWMNLLIHQKINKSFLGFKISIVLSKLATTKNEIYI